MKGLEGSLAGLRRSFAIPNPFVLTKNVCLNQNNGSTAWSIEKMHVWSRTSFFKMYVERVNQNNDWMIEWLIDWIMIVIDWLIDLGVVGTDLGSGRKFVMELNEPGDDLPDQTRKFVAYFSSDVQATLDASGISFTPVGGGLYNGELQ